MFYHKYNLGIIENEHGWNDVYKMWPNNFGSDVIASFVDWQDAVNYMQKRQVDKSSNME